MRKKYVMAIGLGKPGVHCYTLLEVSQQPFVIEVAQQLR